MDRQDREILSEFIELYRKLPCLWDFASDLYKDRHKKCQAWQSLADILKKRDPTADVVLAKKKIEHMRTAYKREENKVKESKEAGSDVTDVYVPKLWYYDLLRPVFNNKDAQSKTGVKSNDEFQPSQKISKGRKLKRKNDEVIETKHKLLLQTDDKPCSFGVYVGEQLEQVNTFQRQVAEKLISEVLFLAKTKNLRFDTKIVSPSGSQGLLKSNNASHSTSSPPKSILSSPSPKYIILKPSPKYIRSSSTSQHTSSASQLKSSPSSSAPRVSKSDEDEDEDEDEEVIEIEGNSDSNPLDSESSDETVADESSSVLKELLIRKEKKQ